MSATAEAILLIGHGTRDYAGLAEFEAAVQLVADLRPDWLVTSAFLELAQPTIDAALDDLVRRGIRQVRVMPLLLFAAGHAKRDIPQAVAEAAARHPHTRIELAPHLGCHGALVALSERRFAEALIDRPQVAPDKTLLVLIGRGSSDAEATVEMLTFAALRRSHGKVGRVEVGFMDVAQPSLEQVLQNAADSAFERIVVQPHLLFTGLVSTKLRETSLEFAARYPEKEWVVVAPLGPDMLLATAVVDTLIKVSSPIEA